MKYLLTISLLCIYMIGSVQPYWKFIDFYWNREDVTLQFCQFLDKGISKCRASCYLEQLRKEGHNNKSSGKYLPTDDPKIQVICQQNEEDQNISSPIVQYRNYTTTPHVTDYHRFVFRPPKG